MMVVREFIQKLRVPAHAASDRTQAAMNRGVLTLQVIYVVGISLWLITQGIFPSLELVFILIITAFVWQAKYRSFFADFAPFLLLLLGYEALRGFANNLAPRDVHVVELIAWEKALFNGVIPATFLQHTLDNQPFTPILNVITNIFYASHFVVPVMVAVVLWQRRKNAYWPFLIGLTVLSYAGFVTFVLYPAAPPWWATYYGYLQDGAVMLSHFALPTVVMFAGPNPVAAMPSLHAAWPMYTSLYCTFVWGKKATPLLLLPFAVSFSAVYLGHHYVVDILAGFLYAFGAFGVAVFWATRKTGGALRSPTTAVAPSGSSQDSLPDRE